MKTSNNVQIVTLTDGRQVCLSYGVAVAAFIPKSHIGICRDCLKAITEDCRGIYEGADGNPTCNVSGQPHQPNALPYTGYIKTDRKWSVTSSKHANAFCGQGATIVPDSVFVQLIAPIEAKGRD